MVSRGGRSLGEERGRGRGRGRGRERRKTAEKGEGIEWWHICEDYNTANLRVCVI